MKHSLMCAFATSVLSLFAMTDFASAQTTTKTQTLNNETTGAKKVLIAYFSQSGNTRAMAKQIKSATGGDLFEIVPLKAYPKEYKVLVDLAKDEIGKGYKPELKSKIDNLSQYDVIFVGSPNWWSTIAPPVATFLSLARFEGKTIVPFMTHGGGGQAHIVADMKKLCPGATFLKALPISGSSVKEAQPEVTKWVTELKLAK